MEAADESAKDCTPADGEMAGNSDLNRVGLQDENGEIVQVLGRVEDQSQSPTEVVGEVLVNISSLTPGSKF